MSTATQTLFGAPQLALDVAIFTEINPSFKAKLDRFLAVRVKRDADLHGTA